MYDRDTIITCASDLVGWRQSADPSHITLTAANLQATSGYLVNELPGISFDLIEPTTYLPDTTNYLERVEQTEIITLVDKVLSRSKQLTGVKELLSNFDPIAGRASFQDTLIQDERFVGFLIMPRRSNNLRAKITYIGMQLDTIQSDPVRIYLYETSQKDAIATFEYQNTDTFSLEWQSVSDFIINYQSLEGGTAQQFLLGYYEPDIDNPQTTQLEGSALTFDLCAGCPGNDAERRKLYQNFIGIAPIEIPNNRLNWNGAEYELPDTDSLESYTKVRTNGLYLKMNITCDITTVLCTNIMMFAHALQLAIAVRVLGDSLASTKHNAVRDSSRLVKNMTDWMLKYNADLNGYMSENGWVKGLVDHIVIDFSNLDRFCLPCKFDKPIIGRAERIGH